MMTDHQLEEYIRLLLEKQPELGDQYVTNQIEWAQAELERLDEMTAFSRVPARSEARTETRLQAGNFAVCASSKFSSGCVVAPQIGLIRETPADKSHR